ncbi:hypothetical protein HUS23_09415 [Ectothiorhodospiraceae bacterium 2226]|nr:hypothetical protein HUS23_09415 [Ectothiorhodospiraceae bacterium 2226]
MRAAVQENCDIADARHAGDYTLCVYLLKMREFYRWEHGYAYTARLPTDALTDWLSAREARWDGLAQRDFGRLPWGEEELDPFDTAQINDIVRGHGLVYSGGLGVRGRPHFFLARLLERRVYRGHTVLIAGEEYARDLAAPPAMTLGDSVFVCRESLQRMIWERFEEWRWNRPDTPMGRALSAYDFEERPEQALAQMTAHETNTVLWHELGELAAGAQLGEGWNEMLAVTAGTPAELFGRAVRDHLADCLVTLPALIDDTDSPSALHFFVGNLGGMRKHVFPALREGYDTWVQRGTTTRLREIAERGAAHWRAVGAEMLAIHEAGGGDRLPRLEALIDARRL